MNSELNITALLAAIREQRDENALAALYDHFGPVLYRVSLGLLSNHDEAAENVQNVFMHVWDKADRYDPARGALSTWLGLLTRSKAIDALRSRARRQARLPFAPGGDMARFRHAHDAGPGPSENSELERQHKALEAGLAQLLPAQALVLRMAYFGGFTQLEIAAKTGWPLGTVKTHCRRALKRLAEKREYPWP